MNNKVDLRIIVIDDNPAIHEDFIKILKTSSSSKVGQLSDELFGETKKKEISFPNFIIDTASQGQEGVERIRQALQEKHPYALAFVDIRMPPGWDGVETIKHIWELDKDIQVVICTAYSDYSWEETVAHLGQTDNLLILKKPFDNIAVRQLACALTKKWQLFQATHLHTSQLQAQVEGRTLSLQKSLSLVKATLESSNDGILVVNNEGKVIDYNKKLIEMLQIPSSIMDSKSEKIIFDFIKDQLTDPESFFDKINELHIHKDDISIDIAHFKNGKIIEYYSQPQKLNDAIVGRVYDFRDVTKRNKLEKELQYQATHDALTGLPNRIMLLNQIQKEIEKVKKNKSSFAILFIDLDRFKLINDSLSHATGDELLKVVSTRLQKCIHKNDILARLGGDEFVIMFADIKNKLSLVSKINKILDLFQVPLKIEDRNITTTVSIGVSIFPSDGTSASILLQNADSAMYSAKEAGGNGFEFYTAEMSVKNLEKLETESQLRQAIVSNELFLVYQPQVDLINEKLVAIEALIRWNHPTKGVLLPIDFIPLAEEVGLMAAIGEWVLRSACHQNKMWQERGLSPVRVAVNVTLQQIKQLNLVALVKSILEETKLDPEYLELELTENVVINNADIMSTLAKLKELGISIALDDFGTGYSSLSYLQKLPLDRLKIDASFIQHIQSEHDDEVIIRAVIAMASSLNLEVLAEGVETKDQVNFLKKNKCLDVQGFYYSKPLNKEDLEIYLSDPSHTEIIKRA